MKRLLGVLVGTLLLAAGCTTGQGSAVDVNNGGDFRFEQGTPSGQSIPEGDRKSAPEFSGKLLDGSSFDSTSLKGDVAVLNFWAHWCIPCRTESPEFQSIYADMHDRGVEFLGLNVKDSDEQFGKAFVRRYGIGYPSVFDPGGEVALAFRDFPVDTLPSTIVLDREGRVAAVYIGEVDEAKMRQVIDQLLAES